MNNNPTALNEQVEAENDLTTTPVVEEKASVDEFGVELPAESTEEAATDQPTQEAEESSPKGANQRIRELNARAKEAEAKAQSLAEKLAQLTNSQQPAVNTVNNVADEPIVAPGEEIDTLELDRRLRAREDKLMQRADALVTLRNKQNDTLNRINTEAVEAVKAFPELDPDSERFNKDLSETVTEAVEAHIKADPFNASVKSFVAKLMKPYQAAVAKEVGQASENLAKQVSQAALRPTSVRKAEKSASEKSIAELEKELGMVQA